MIKQLHGSEPDDPGSLRRAGFISEDDRQRSTSAVRTAMCATRAKDSVWLHAGLRWWYGQWWFDRHWLNVQSGQTELRRPRCSRLADCGRQLCFSSEDFLVLAVGAEFGAGPGFCIE